MEGEQVIEKILSDARAEADRIKKQAEEKRAEQKAKADEQLNDYRKQSEQLAAKAGEDTKNQMLAAARMQIAKEYLAEKVKILDEVFEQAQQRLKRMGDEDYRKLMAKLMAGAVETGDEEVVIDKDEKRIDASLIQLVNAEKKSNLKPAGEREDIGGGFILRRGKIKNNLSLGVLLGQARKELEIELAKMLFPA